MLQWVMFYHQRESIYNVEMTYGHLDRNPLSLLMCVFHLPGSCIQHHLALSYPVGLMFSSPHDEAVTSPGAQRGDRDAAAT